MRWYSWVSILMAESHWLAVRRMRWSYWLTRMLITLIGCLKRGGRTSLADFSVETTGPSEDNPFANNSHAIVGGGKNEMILLVDWDADHSHWLFEARREEPHWLISVSRRLDPVRGQPFCQQQSRHFGSWGWKGMLIALIGCIVARRKNLIGWFQCRDDWTLSEDIPFANNSLAIVGRGIVR